MKNVSELTSILLLIIHCHQGEVYGAYRARAEMHDDVKGDSRYSSGFGEREPNK